ncbi:MAG: hypothetical protein RJA36_1405 [Pseudomonadota bacterium]|jgi:hypothetical protein
MAAPDHTTYRHGQYEFYRPGGTGPWMVHDGGDTIVELPPTWFPVEVMRYLDGLGEGLRRGNEAGRTNLQRELRRCLGVTP